MEVSTKKRCQFCGVGMLTHSHKCIVCNEIQHDPTIIERRLDRIYLGQHRAQMVVFSVFLIIAFIASIDLSEFHSAPYLMIIIMIGVLYLYMKFSLDEFNRILSANSTPKLLQEIESRRAESILTQVICYCLSIALIVLSIYLYRAKPSFRDFEKHLVENTSLTTDSIIAEKKLNFTHSFLVNKDGTQKIYMGIGNSFFELEPEDQKRKEWTNLLKFWK